MMLEVFYASELFDFRASEDGLQIFPMVAPRFISRRIELLLLRGTSAAKWQKKIWSC